MIGFVTAVIVISLLIWPVSFVVALIFKLFKVKKMSENIYSGTPDDFSENDEQFSEAEDGVEFFDADYKA